MIFLSVAISGKPKVFNICFLHAKFKLLTWENKENEICIFQKQINKHKNLIYIVLPKASIPLFLVKNCTHNYIGEIYNISYPWQKQVKYRIQVVIFPFFPLSFPSNGRDAPSASVNPPGTCIIYPPGQIPRDPIAATSIFRLRFFFQYSTQNLFESGIAELNVYTVRSRR